jgi:hypothetical protein
VSERSANAMSADVSTYALVFLPIDDVVELLTGLGITGFDHSRISHPGFGFVDREHESKRTSEELS